MGGDSVDFRTIRTWHFSLKCLSIMWNSVNFLFVGCLRSIIVLCRVMPKSSLLSSNNSISYVFIWTSLPYSQVFWHAQSLSTFLCSYVFKIASSSGTKHIVTVAKVNCDLVIHKVTRMWCHHPSTRSMLPRQALILVWFEQSWPD